jgi:N-acetylmuramate 1-kinase
VSEAFEQAILAAIHDAGFAGAQRQPLAQDASTRAYERLTLGHRSAMLMKAPRANETDGPCDPLAGEEQRRARGWNWTSRLAASRVEAFAAVSAHLRSLGFSAPEVLAVDPGMGVAVVEDLGPGVFADILRHGEADETQLYALAGELLATLHAAPVPASLPAPGGIWPLLDFDRLALEVNADLFVEWVPQFLGGPAFPAHIVASYHGARSGLIARAQTMPRAFTLRDYHAENLIWLPQRAGVARIGLLDFQDAVHGYRAWDFSMLLHDARRDVSPAAHEAALLAYCAATGGDRAALERELAVQGALNCLRIIGIFARLIHRDRKPRYRAFLPRMVDHLRTVLADPALGEMGDWIAAHAPLDAIAGVARG